MDVGNGIGGVVGVIAPTLRAAIKAIYKSGILNAISTQRCEVVPYASWATFYNLEMIIALAFRLNTYEASMIRREMLNCFFQGKREFRLFIVESKNKFLNS